MTRSPSSRDFLDPPEQDDEIGRLGPYRVVGLLGKGGMGEVFLAQDTRLKRNVALKVMTRRFARTKNSRQRFIDEARSMAAIHHENVAIIFDVGEANETPYMAMEMLKGKTLFEWRQEGRLFSDEEIIEIGMQLSRGLAAAHECGIIHRDIKPANIWIEEPTGRVKILDFGLALADVGVDALSGRGHVIGSPGYLAPEQARDDPLDDRTDLYSVGVVLYELCVSDLPSRAKSMPGQLISIIAHDPEPITDLNPDVKPALADVIHCLLSKEAVDRPDSALHLEAMLEYAAHASSDAPVETLASETVVSSVLDTHVDTLKPQIVQSTKEKRVTAGARSTVAKQDRKTGSAKSNKPKRTTEPIEQTHSDNRGPGSKQKKSKLPLILCVVVALIAIPLVYYFATRNAVVVNAPMPERPSTSQSKVTQQVTPASLKPLEILEITHEGTEVKVGNALQFTLSMSNTATSAATDPKKVNARAKSVAQLSTYAQQVDKPRKRVTVQKLKSRSLPSPGQKRDLQVMFFATDLVPKVPCEVVFEIQTPDGRVVSSASKTINIVD